METITFEATGKNIDNKIRYLVKVPFSLHKNDEIRKQLLSQNMVQAYPDRFLTFVWLP